VHFLEYKIGDKLENYKVVKILGGGMGRVYICIDEIKQELYALKTFKEEFISSEEIKKSFLKEALAWINLGDHPNIVRCYAPFNYLDQLFVIIEYIQPHLRWGNTLTDYFQMDLNLKQSLILAIQFCHGMEHAISRGILCHRDIKPDNIMITRETTLKITDFGLVKVFDEFKNSEKFKKLTTPQKLGFLDVAKKKVIVGTPPWMAPEQFEGNADIRSDIYSFGVVLYQMINRGKLPFLAKTVNGYYSAHKTSKIPKCKSELFPVIKKCLQKNPKERYQTFKDLLKDLEKIYHGKFGEMTYTVEPREIGKVYEYVNRGMVLAKGGMYDKAIIELNKAIEIDPSIPQIYLNLGSIYSGKKSLIKQ